MRGLYNLVIGLCKSQGVVSSISEIQSEVIWFSAKTQSDMAETCTRRFNNTTQHYDKLRTIALIIFDTISEF